MGKRRDKEPDYIKGIREEDASVIQAIYRNFHQSIVYFVENNSGNDEDGHDLFQEGLVVIFKKVQDPDFQLTSSFYTFFYAICRNLWYHKLRRKSIEGGTLSPEMQLKDEDNSEALTTANDQYYLYRKMFLQLGEDCQKLLELFLQKVSMSEIMDIMGFSSITYTKKRKFICKERLIKSVQDHPSYSELTMN